MDGRNFNLRPRATPSLGTGDSRNARYLRGRPVRPPMASRDAVECRLTDLGQRSGMTPELVSLLFVHGQWSGAFDRWSCAPCGVTVAARIRCIHGRGHGSPRRLVRANLEHDLATLPAARDSLERRPCLPERKNRVD